MANKEGIAMYEFFEYVLDQLKNSLILALLALFAAGVVLLVAWLIHRAKFHGERKFPLVKALLLIALVGYSVIVLYATILRFSGGYREVNFHLFRAWREAWNSFSPKNWANVLLNVAMFVPLGFLLPAIWKPFRKWYLGIFAGLGVSAVIELIQLATNRGICDVDDLLANAFGAVIGYFLIMAVLSVFGDKGKRTRYTLLYGLLFLVSIFGILGIFVIYELQPYGNLPMAATYTNDTSNVHWKVEYSSPVVPASLPVYRTQSRSISDCDAFAEKFLTIIDTEYTTISYYEEAAYYMDQSGGDNGAHFLLVYYLDQSFDYTYRPSGRFGMQEPEWGDADRETLAGLLERFPVMLPEYAQFATEGEGWYSFAVDRHVDGAMMIDGTLRCRYASDGTLREIENHMLSYVYEDTVEVISPEEAVSRLQKGEFNDEGYFEYQAPGEVSILSCEVTYEIDTKGFYQPVYAFELKSDDGRYESRIIVPAMK